MFTFCAVCGTMIKARWAMARHLLTIDRLPIADKATLLNFRKGGRGNPSPTKHQ